jgi:hypothetical protein
VHPAGEAKGAGRQFVQNERKTRREKQNQHAMEGEELHMRVERKRAWTPRPPRRKSKQQDAAMPPRTTRTKKGNNKQTINYKRSVFTLLNFNLSFAGVKVRTEGGG